MSEKNVEILTNKEYKGFEFEFPWKQEKPDINPEVGKFVLGTLEEVGVFDEHPHLRQIAIDLQPSRLGRDLYPFSTVEKMKAISLWLTIYFLYDDLLEGASESEVDKIVKATAGEMSNADSEPRSIIRAMDKSGQYVRTMPKLSLETFKNSIREYLISLSTEKKLLSELPVKGHPKISEYLNYRNPCSGVMTMMDIVDLEMPDAILEKWYKNPLLAEIKKSGQIIIVCYNDYFSLINGRDDDMMNFCFALCREFLLEREEAKKLMVEIHDANTKRLVRLCDQLIKETNQDPTIILWTRMIQNMLSGLARFHTQVKRYEKKKE